MTQRSLAFITALAAGIAVASLVSVSVAGQTRAAALRTPWGEPDLQGIWNDDTQTPLERPARFAGREFLTEQEVAALNRQRAQNPGRDRRNEAGTEKDVAGAYNAVWNSVRKAGNRTSLVVDPPDGKVPPLTAEAQKREAQRRDYLEALLQGTSGGRPGPPSPRRAETPATYNLDRMNRADGPEDRSRPERCMGSTLPDFGEYMRIVQSPGSVAIYHEHGQGGGGNRIIPITNAPHLPSHIRQWYGDARGRWEGNTLVVDTTNFSLKTDYRGSRENLHLIERFTRLDADTLNYRVTIEDPTTWTRPWTISIDMSKNEDRFNRIFESTCHEGNFGLTGMLANTRAAEKAFTEGRGPDPATMDIATGGGGGAEQ